MADYDEPAAGGAWIRLTVFLLIVGGAGYGAWWYLQRLPSDAVEPAAAGAPADAAPTSTFASGPTSGAKPDQSKGAAQTADGTRAGGEAFARGGASGRSASASEAPQAGLPAQPSSSTPAGASGTAGGSGAEPDRAASATGPAARKPRSEIFDVTSAGVAAPLLITPGANTPLLTGTNHPKGTPGIEIIINADGFVGSVKAVTEPRSLAESLEYHNGLSVAKSWQFQPATLDGQPVKFKIFMPLAILRTRSAIK